MTEKMHADGPVAWQPSLTALDETDTASSIRTVNRPLSPGDMCVRMLQGLILPTYKLQLWLIEVDGGRGGMEFNLPRPTLDTRSIHRQNCRFGFLFFKIN